MRTLVHLSDLHFGRLDERLITPLVQRIVSINPDLVAISGDFTQRALRRQFVQARAFLDLLPMSKIAVPGNHDVPLYNVAARVLHPFDLYRRYVSDDLEPRHIDDEIAVLGLNSARAFITGGRGRLSRSQVEHAQDRLRPLAASLVKIIVTHHPFDLPAGHPAQHLIGRAQMAMAAFAGVGADLFLAGHLHLSHIGHTAERYSIAGHSALVVQAGTLSTRGRGELNTFNVLHIARPQLTIERYTWDPDNASFARAWTGAFRHTERGWTA